MTYRTSDNMLKYNALDCGVTWQCKDGFFDELEIGYQETYDHTISLYEPLMYMMIRGMRVDHDRLKETKLSIEKRLAELKKEITERCGRFVNPNSPKDCCQYFYVEKGVSPYTKYNKKSKKSTVTCDDKALQRIAKGTTARRALFEAKLIQEYRKLWKLKGTYLEINFDKDNRMRCDYKPRGTKFGRLSSAKTIFETGMNMQNLPEEFSGFLCSDPGKLLIAIDKAKAEWVVVAYESGDASMINAIESGVDVHAYTASQMFKIPIDVIEFEDKIVGKISDPIEIKKKRELIRELDKFRGGWFPRTMSMRQCGKKSNHGLNYDERANRFALENEITDKEAGVIIEFYHSIYPGIRNSYYKKIQNKLGKDRILENCLGRKCRFLDRWGDDLFKAAYSFIPQSTVGDIINRGMVQVYHDESPVFSSWEILRQVHDELQFQANYDNTIDLARGIVRAANTLTPKLSGGGREYTIGTDCKIGFSLDRMIPIPIGNVTEMAADIEKGINALTTTQ